MASSGAGPAKLPKAKREIVALSVRLEVITPDKLRRIIFGLTKGTAEGNVTWTINFELFDRASKTDEFGEPIVKLDVSVKAKNNALAEETAAKGMNAAQVEHTILRAGPAAAELAAAPTPEKEKKAERQIEKTLEVRAQG